MLPQTMQSLLAKVFYRGAPTAVVVFQLWALFESWHTDKQVAAAADTDVPLAHMLVYEAHAPSIVTTLSK
jgi:hypothetical protein